VVEPQISVFVHSTGVIETEGDKKYFIHPFELVKLFRMKKSIKIISGRKLMATGVINRRS
jgi:hypothetical protein